jgi:hypothetical protein
MQADILDTILAEVGRNVHVVDPFVGSGTVMTEAMRRGLNFTGIDINPLAILTCQAKASIEEGIALDSAVIEVLEAVKKDWSTEVAVNFNKLEKWFEPHQAILFSRFRRAISGIPDRAKRQCLWVAFAETIRSCSNTRTSTYKLHIRAANDTVSESAVAGAFEKNLYDLLDRAAAYRADRGVRTINDPLPELICTSVDRADFVSRGQHTVVVTSPPYGDNRTTIPYGQFSYLPLNWIPQCDLPPMPVEMGLATAAAIDTASLGGSLRGAGDKTRNVEEVSMAARTFFADARAQGKDNALRKVGAFLWDYYGALKHIRSLTTSRSHWVITLGNRTSANMPVPFDRICQDFIECLGGSCLEVVQRQLPVKRMPNRNSQGVMITTEKTLVASFGS